MTCFLYVIPEGNLLFSLGLPAETVQHQVIGNKQQEEEEA